MQDTTTPQNFVLYGCDTWAIIAELSCDTPNALASELQKHCPMMALPESTDWGFVAAIAFQGFPARILNGQGNETFLLISAPVLPFFTLETDNNRMVSDVPTYWTLDQYQVAIRL